MYMYTYTYVYVHMYAQGANSIGGPSWGFGWPFGVYVGSCGAPIGVWEVQRLHGRGLEELGLAQERLGTRKWAQHGPNLSQVGANLRRTWAQDDPTGNQLEAT